MKKAGFFLIATLIALTGCVNYRAKIPSTSLQPGIFIKNNTNYHLTIDIDGINKVIDLHKSEIKSIKYPQYMRSAKLISIKITAWDQNNFPVGSTSKIITASQNNRNNNPTFIWEIRKQDLEY